MYIYICIYMYVYIYMYVINAIFILDFEAVGSVLRLVRVSGPVGAVGATRCGWGVGGLTSPEALCLARKASHSPSLI